VCPLSGGFIQGTSGGMQPPLALDSLGGLCSNWPRPILQSSLSFTIVPDRSFLQHERCNTNDEAVDSQGVDEGLVHVTLERGCPFLQEKWMFWQSAAPSYKRNGCFGNRGVSEGPTREVELRRGSLRPLSASPTRNMALS
jgi:hypothetical protein